jgi:hypothetical protein
MPVARKHILREPFDGYWEIEATYSGRKRVSVSEDSSQIERRSSPNQVDL